MPFDRQQTHDAFGRDFQPFVAHFGVDRAEAFDPSRFAEGAAAAPPLIPFATAADGRLGALEAPGEQLVVSMAKAIYVQSCRMFEDVKLGASPEPTPAGYPLCTLAAGVEALFKARMYYELQRGVKKLRF